MFERIKLMNKDKFPKVVIGVCTYNRCLGLKRLLQSLIKLDYPNFEIIVVDNNSTDQTAKIISEFEKVKYIFDFLTIFFHYLFPRLSRFSDLPSYSPFSP